MMSNRYKNKSILKEVVGIVLVVGREPVQSERTWFVVAVGT